MLDDVETVAVTFTLLKPVNLRHQSSPLSAEDQTTINEVVEKKKKSDPSGAKRAYPLADARIELSYFKPVMF